RDPKIMDFGIAKLETSQLTTTGQVLGTTLYMSPEQSLGHTVDHRTDIFSLGSVAYTLLTGKPAFEAPIVPVVLARVAYFTPPPVSEVVGGLPPDVDYVVARAMAKAPSDRYPDGKMLAEDAGDVAAGRPPRHRGAWVTPPPSAPEGAPRSAKPRARSGRWFVRLMLLLAILTGAYLYFDPAARPARTSERDAAAGKLAIDFQHDVRRGTITVLVDGKRMLEDDFDSRVTRKTLQPTLTLSPGRHDVRVQVKWEDHLTTGRLFG